MIVVWCIDLLFLFSFSRLFSSGGVSFDIDVTLAGGVGDIYIYAIEGAERAWLVEL